MLTSVNMMTENLPGIMGRQHRDEIRDRGGTVGLDLHSSHHDSWDRKYFVNFPGHFQVLFKVIFHFVYLQRKSPKISGLGRVLFFDRFIASQ